MSFPLFQLDQVGVWAQAQPFLTGVSGQIPARAITAVLGPAGSGKSMLLHCLNRFAVWSVAHPTPRLRQTGTITYRGQSLTAWDDYDMGKRIVMVVPQAFPGSIFDNVAFGLRGQGLAKVDLMARVGDCLTQVGLGYVIGSWDQKPDFSPGQLQQLSLARALAIAPDVLLLDEPWMNLDVTAQGELLHLLQALRYQSTIILSSRQYRQATSIADWVILLDCEGTEGKAGGTWVDAGPPNPLLTNPASERTQQYLTQWLR